MKQLVIAGGGFAGFWSAMSAARQAAALGESGRLTITLVNRNAYFGIRPRFYEGELEPARIPLSHWLEPLGIRLIVGEIVQIRPDRRRLRLDDGRELSYDALILATGSSMRQPAIPGREKLFSADTFDEAADLELHLKSLAASGFPSAASRTFVVVGGSFTGLEIATALPGRIRRLAASDPGFVFHLVDRSPEIGLGYEPEARRHIMERLQQLGIHVHAGREVLRYDDGRLVLGGGEELAADTVIGATGLQASPLTEAFPGQRDALGRLPVDAFLRLPAHPEVLAAGDVSLAKTDAEHWAVMSCQHAMPQGKFAGHNAVNMLFGLAPMPYAQPRYVTCLDLGPEDALVTSGWERRLKTIGPEAKALKTEILTRWIYPAPGIEETLAMSAPEVQR